MPRQTQSLYPTDALKSPAEQQGEVSGQAYRLQEITRLRKCLEDERDIRFSLYKKYRRGANIMDLIDSTLLTATVGMGIGGVTLLSTIIAAPVALALEGGALVCGVLGGAGKLISRKLALKAKKHDEIRVLAESKLNSIIDLVSAALQDGNISDVEFRLVVDEVSKYHQMKKDIRSKTPSTLDAETIKELIQKGRDEALAELTKRLASV